LAGSIAGGYVDVAGDDVDAGQDGGVAADHHALHLVARENLEDPLGIKRGAIMRHRR
jgi:hypothetical protein